MLSNFLSLCLGNIGYTESMEQTDLSTNQNKDKSITNIYTYINIFYLHSVTSGESQAI